MNFNNLFAFSNLHAEKEDTITRSAEGSGGRVGKEFIFFKEN